MFVMSKEEGKIELMMPDQGCIHQPGQCVGSQHQDGTAFPGETDERRSHLASIPRLAGVVESVSASLGQNRQEGDKVLAGDR